MLFVMILILSDFGQSASSKGRYLFETFTNQINRKNLALSTEWNKMTGIKQWMIKERTPMITGRSAVQSKYGFQYIGGSTQLYIKDLNNLLEVE